MDNVAQQVAFWTLAALIVSSALAVVTTKNVVRAALYLVLVLAGIGAQYVLLSAEFVATVQYMVYIGAIVVLFLFGIMLTRAPIGGESDLSYDNKVVPALVAVGLAVLLGLALIDGFSDEELGPDGELVLTDGAGELVDDLTDELGDDPTDAERDGVRELRDELPTTNTQTVSDSIFSDYIVPFEAISVLLLAALIGAIVLARRD